MPTFKIILYKQKTLKDGCHPVMLQVVNDSKVTRISLGYKCLPNEWDDNACKFKRNVSEHTKRNKILRSQLDKAESAWDTIQALNKPFTPALFKEIFTGEKKTATVKEFINILRHEFDQKEQVSNNLIYKTLNNRIHDCWGKKSPLLFPDIDFGFLKKFEAFLFAGGCSGGGVHHYMRTLRAIYNQAIQRNYVEENLYPFSTVRNKNGYSLSNLKSTARPRALSSEDIEKIKSFPIDQHPELKQSWQLFLFSYYARGMNLIDQAQLKWTDIYNGRIHYIRSKTGNSFSIKINENLQSILDQLDKGHFKQIFPLLTDSHQTKKQIYHRVQRCRRKYHKDLNEIASLLSINVNMTSYVARHTFATTLKRNNISTSLIKESMGHKDESTTKAYLAQFENDELDKLDELL